MAGNFTRVRLGPYKEEVFVESLRSAMPVPCVFPLQPYSLSLHWPKSFADGWIDPIEPNRHTLLAAYLHSAMTRYHAAPLKDLVTETVMGSRISFNGLELGGTVAPGTVFIASGRENYPHTSAFIKRIFHHELAHLVLMRVGEWQVEKEWSKTLPVGFSYPRSGFDAVRAGYCSDELQPSWFDRGFLTQYSASSFDEDFCMMAENLFSGSLSFWHAVVEHPALMRKVQITIEVYNQAGFGLTIDSCRENLKPGIQ